MSARRDLGLAAVAKRAGVSTATVSNALNRPEIVRAETRERIQKAIDELDFVPNRAAATLRQGHNRLLGLVIPDITNPFYAAIVDAVVDAADRERYAVALCASHDDPARERRHLSVLAEQRAAGAIVVPLTADSSRLAHLRLIGSRLIIVDRVADTAENCSVAVDDVYGGRLAVEHLLTCVGEGITLVNGPTSIPQCASRREGALAALTEHDGPQARLTEYEVAEMTIDAGFEVGVRVAADGAPRRIFCTNDQLATGVMRGLASAGVRVPDEASVVGYGDLSLASPEHDVLTSVNQPKQALGAEAVQLLLEELTEGDRHEHEARMLRPELVLRSSTRSR
ncbi:LacI family DNA-binding transcriptional regulator [Agromyces silvae]|uniref:LacI family DNA-binding transcriptional regulator n=1 Tax=Agromyces silvae TaxID=3388266 RepID=UPI00280A7507|nr:LacI family DNA-binding transcriptional regulator [Agromyces protaetiae]